MNSIKLTEFEPLILERADLTEQFAQQIWDDYKNYVDIELPSFKTDSNWRITSRGWVGIIQINDELQISFHPKTPINNIFEMLMYAYAIKSIELFDELAACQSIKEAYEFLARKLCLFIFERCSKGLYRVYEPHSDDLPYVRGSIDLPKLLTRADKTRLPCSYKQHSADIEDNQILAWTIHAITRCIPCNPETLTMLHTADRSLVGYVSLTHFSPDICKNRTYNPLNEDYQAMHAICRFFLENLSPSEQVGSSATLPFMVNMAVLYERFVFEWLKANISDEYHIERQMVKRVGVIPFVNFEMDIVIRSKLDDRVKYVLDTKYKVAEKPSTNDVFQVVSYAEMLGCSDAILVYPESSTSFVGKVGDITVKALEFKIDGNLQECGENFLRALEKI